ncbi:MAG: hypothetical protein ACI823_002457, partial [Chitinophagales bacterium]
GGFSDSPLPDLWVAPQSKCFFCSATKSQEQPILRLSLF